MTQRGPVCALDAGDGDGDSKGHVPRRPVISLLLALLCLAAAPLEAPASEPDKELILWGVGRRPGLDAAFRLFEAEHPGWTIITSAGATAGRMDPQKLMCAIAGGDPPDTLIQDRFSVGEWAVRDAFLALDELLRESIRQEQWATAARDALRAGRAAEAVAPLRELIAALEPLGPSRQLAVARQLAKAVSRDRPAGEVASDADALVELCQGIRGETFYRACWQEACFGEGEARRVYAVPNTTDDRALYYNTDLLERAGLVDERGKARPPRDWEELKDYAVKLTERDARGGMTQLGFAPNYGNSWLYIYGWLNGGTFMSDDGRTCTLNDPRIVEALEFMVDVYDALGGVQQVNAFQSTFQSGEFDPFLTGKVAMKIDGDWFQNTIANNAPNLRFGVVPAPAPTGRESVTWSGGFSWVIPSGAANPRIAFELIRFLNTDRIWMLRNVVESKYSASRGRAYVPQMAPLPHINQMVYERFVRDNPNLADRIKTHFLLFADLMKTSRFRPVTPAGQLLWDEHVRAFEKAVAHTYTPQEALDRGTRNVQQQLDILYEKTVYPKVNWLYPILTVAGLLAAGGAFVYFRFGRRNLLRRAVHPESLAGYTCASPWLIGFCVLTAGPIVISILYSFCRYDVLHEAEFVGLDNYRRLLFDDPLFWKSLANTGFMMLGIPLGMAVGLGVAMLLNTKVRGMQIYRTIFYLPAIVPAVASSILWIWVLNPQSGLINSFLKMLGVTDLPGWLTIADFTADGWRLGAKSAIIVMGLWGAGAGMIIWLAGLKGIPQHLYEAAEIDGAGPWKRFRHVTLPMLSPYIFFNLIMGIIGTLQIFAQAYIMTGGGPDDSTMYYAYYLFNNAFRYFKMGYASALAWILFLIILALTLIQLKLAPRWVHYESE